jgi:hypothetical protein
MEMVTVNLLREGVNKHKARELAEHFYSFAPAAQPVPVQEPSIAACIIGSDAVGKKIDGYEAAKVYAAMQKAMGTPPAAQPAPVPLTDEQKLMCWSRATHDADVEHKTEHQCLMDYGSEIEAAHNIRKV